MAKKFLESLGEAFGEDVLVDLIPTREQRNKQVAQKKTTTPSKPPAAKKSSRGKKRFLDQIDQQMKASRPERSPQKNHPKRSTRKSFLDTIEEALDSNIFDEIIPEKPAWQRAKGQKPASPKEVQERFSTMITKEVLDRAREIAKLKGIRVKEVINAALRYYLDQVGEK